MDDAVTLSVPELVEATYVVATARPPADVQAAARESAQRLPEPLRVGALRMLAGPLLSVTMSTVGESPPLPVSFLGVFGASATQLRDLDAATHVIVCQAVFRPGWPPAHEWHARGVAAGVAELTGGTLIDMFTPQLLDPAAAVRSLPDPDGRIVLVRWVLVPQSAGDRGLWMTTKGLGRFGLPELQVLDVPPVLAGSWTRVMSGAAARWCGCGRGRCRASRASSPCPAVSWSAPPTWTGPTGTSPDPSARPRCGCGSTRRTASTGRRS
ncbi:hypothetical protein [Dactylosporangium cerinum]